MTKKRVPADDIFQQAEKLGLLSVLKRLIRRGEKLDDIDIDRLRRAERSVDPPRFDRDGFADDMPVHRGAGDTTHGRAVDNNGVERTTRSGHLAEDRAQIDAVNDRLRERGLPYRSGNAHHAEQKYATEISRDRSVTEADLVINNPDGPCPDELGCDDVLPRLLRPDQTLRVHWRSADGVWRMIPYQGVP